MHHLPRDAPPRKYYVQVPPGVREGMHFDVIVNASTRITVVCPTGCKEGDRLSIEAFDVGTPAYQEVVEIQRLPPAFVSYNPEQEAILHTTRVKRRQASLSVWLFFTVVTFIFLVLSYSLPKFGTQYLSTACGAINPRSGTTMTVAYYNLFKGYGSSPECVNSGRDFCVPWSDQNTWGKFDTAGNVMGSYATTTYSFQNTQVTSVLASGFCLLAVAVFASAIRNSNKSVSAGIATCGSYLILLVWLLSLIAIDAVAYASAMSNVVWQRFFNNGNNIAVLTDNAPTSTVAATTSCSVNITYEDGGALLSVSVALAFGLSLSILLSMCCAGDTWIGDGPYVERGSPGYSYTPSTFATTAVAQPPVATTAVYSTSGAVSPATK